MKRLAPLLLSFLLLIPSLSAGLEIMSIYPDEAIVGGTVTVIGEPFSDSVRVILGGQEIIPRLIDERQLAFTVPQLEVGQYALYLTDGQETSAQTISLAISLPPPRIDSLEPANIDECSTAEDRTVTLRGSFFQEGAQLLMGDQVVPSTRSDEGEISFVVPPLSAGTYGVKVLNPDGGESTAHSLWLNNIPHIFDVGFGEDYVSSYQLIINGKNFSYNSSLIVYEYPVDLTDLPPRQHVVTSQGGSAFRGEQARQQQSESLIFIDCNKLIYNRYPYSGQEKTLVLRVGNPDGKQTEPYELSAP